MLVGLITAQKMKIIEVLVITQYKKKTYIYCQNSNLQYAVHS